MTQLTWERSPPRPPEGGRNGKPPNARTGAGPARRRGGRGDVVPTAAGRSLFHRLGCLGTWFGSDEGPPLTPEEEEERWRLLFGCGF